MKPNWKPPLGLEPRLRQAGIGWKAVRVPVEIGERVLILLGDDNGAVVQDQSMYWFVPAETAPRPALDRLVLLPRRPEEAAYVCMPPVHWNRGPGFHWRMPADRGLTPGDLLFVAARIALNTSPADLREASL
ncbi:hypothetical protein [Streptomyces palmae]|uniref:hypothetical protein n=1 Tax=Streptomyces palmae TaxID=1701085 RepID=UPI001AE05D54|nr:hypothetical protein [Streptomyces palmae]